MYNLFCEDLKNSIVGDADSPSDGSCWDSKVAEPFNLLSAKADGHRSRSLSHSPQHASSNITEGTDEDVDIEFKFDPEEVSLGASSHPSLDIADAADEDVNLEVKVDPDDVSLNHVFHSSSSNISDTIDEDVNVELKFNPDEVFRLEEHNYALAGDPISVPSPTTIPKALKRYCAGMGEVQCEMAVRVSSLRSW